ncbi:MAG: LAGLIDADG family homing endonuclease [Patescibacteria group bacterium]
MRKRNKKGQFAPTVLTNKEKKDIVFQYKKGLGLRKIAKSYCIADNRLKRILKKAGISLRNILSRPPRKWTKEKILQTLRERYERDGQSPKCDDDLGLSSAACRRFGFWNKALLTAGLPLNRVHKYKVKRNAHILTSDKAYILGTLCGDGCQKTDRFQIKLSVLAKDKEFIEEFADCFFRTYGIRKEPIEEERMQNGRVVSYTTVIIDSKQAYLDLKRYGEFGVYVWRVPGQIKNGDEDIKKAFLQGYFNSDGSVDVRGHRVTAYSANYKGLSDIARLLKDFGIKAKIYPSRKGENTYFHLYLHNWQNLNKFKEIGFSLSRKQEKVLMSLKTYKYKSISK